MEPKKDLVEAWRNARRAAGLANVSPAQISALFQGFDVGARHRASLDRWAELAGRRYWVGDKR